MWAVFAVWLINCSLETTKRTVENWAKSDSIIGISVGTGFALSGVRADIEIIHPSVI